MEEEEIKAKSPDEYAEKQVNRIIGQAIAKRKIKIRQLEAEIAKLKSGEMTPDEKDCPSHSGQDKKEVKNSSSIFTPSYLSSPFSIAPTQRRED